MKKKLPDIWARWLSLCLLLLLTPLYSYGQTNIGDCKYILSVSWGNRTASLAGYSKNLSEYPSELKIPSSVTSRNTKYTVNSVAANAFLEATTLNRIELPVTVTTINSNAFYECSGLTSVELGGSTTIKSSAFANCTHLQAVYFSSGIANNKNISNAAFPVNTPPITAYFQESDFANSKAKSQDLGMLPVIYNSSAENELSVSPALVELQAGNSQSLTVTSKYNQYGITFVSNNKNVATVDDNGNIDAVAGGTTTVTVNYGSLYSIDVPVVVGDESIISVTPQNNSVQINNEITLTAEGENLKGKTINWSVNDPTLARLVPNAENGTCKVIILAHGGSFVVTASVNAAEEGQPSQMVSAISVFNISSNIVNSSQIISVAADHNVMQEISYCGRGNPNEPLTKVVFYNQKLKDLMAGVQISDGNLVSNNNLTQLINELCQYSVTLKPNFNSVGGTKELKNLRAYVRIYPQTNTDQSKGNPLRGDMDKGVRTGPVPPEKAIDLGVFDYRAPLLTSHQTTFDLGFLKDAEGNNAMDNLVTGTEYSVKMSESVARQMIEAYKGVYDNLSQDATYLTYYDPRFFIYICADIDEQASDMNSNDRNKIGGVVTKVVTPNGTYTGKGIISSFRTFSTSATTDLVPNWPENVHHMKYRAQTDYSRTILYRRVLAYMPFDGYSRYYRIPGLTDLQDGTLVMTTDARKYHNHDVTNNFDVISRVSQDNGATWSQPNIVAEGTWPGENDCSNAEGFGDAAVGDLPTPGNVIAVFLSGKGLASSNGDGPKVMYSISTTSGRSWGEPKRIPVDIFSYDQASDKNGAIACPGPGRMCQITKGKHAGKLLFAAYQWVEGTSNRGPLTFLAYDENKDTWENLGHFGDTSDVIFGESQLVEIPRGNDEPMFIVSVRNESGGERRWILITPDKDASTYFPSFERSTGSNLSTVMANVNATKTGNQNLVLLTEDMTGEEPTYFGNGAGPCNSNFIVYKNSDGNSEDDEYYLVQALPMGKSQEIGYGTGKNRARLTLKVANITSLVKTGILTSTLNDGTTANNVINWVSTGLDFSDPLNVLSPQYVDGSAVDSNKETGYMNTGYSCVSTQKDGKIGVATEEYPYNYRPAPEISGDGTDVLLSGWYNSVTLNSITFDKPIIEKTAGREIPKPTTYPETATFKIDVTQVEQYTDKNHEGVFVDNSAYSLPAIKFTVNPDDVKLLTDDEGNLTEKWRIDYDFYYRLHGTTTGVKIYSFHGPWYNGSETVSELTVMKGGKAVQHVQYDAEGNALKDAEGNLQTEDRKTKMYMNTDGTWSVEMTLPVMTEDFANIVVPELEEAAGISYSDWNSLTPEKQKEYVEKARSDGYIHADDSFVVRARVGVYDKNYDDNDYATAPDEIKALILANDWTANRIDQGLINATGYYAVSPSRKMVVHIRPQGVDASVEMSTEYATATFTNATNVPGDTNSGLWLFGRPSFDLYKVRLHAQAPDNSPARFLGFTLNKNLTLDEDNFDDTNKDLLRNQTGPWIEGYELDDDGNVDPTKPVYAKASKDNSDYTYIKANDKLDNTNSEKPVPFMNVHALPDHEQINFYVPSNYTYAGDKDDYDRLDIYAWFASDGGLFSTCELRYDYCDVNEWGIASNAGFATDDQYLKILNEESSGELQAPARAASTRTKTYDEFVKGKPEPQFDNLEYPLTPFGEACIFSNGKLQIPYNSEIISSNGDEVVRRGYDGGYFELSMIPDKYGYDKCAAVSVWSIDSNGGYVPATSTKQFTIPGPDPETGSYSYSYSDVESTPAESSMSTVYGKGYENDAAKTCWSDDSSLPQEVVIPVSFNGCFGSEKKGENTLLGMVLITVNNIPVADAGLSSFLATESTMVNSHYNTTPASSEEPQAVASRVATYGAPAETFQTPLTYYRVAFPVYASAKDIATSVNEVEVNYAGEDAYYDMMGCKVSEPVKGRIYVRIHNGRASKILY